jgi:hypothetical protein
VARIKSESELAPHGRDDQGEPKAPYGYLVNGLPRKGNRGARPKSKGGGPAKTGVDGLSPTDKSRKDMLVTLQQMVLVNGLVTLSVVPGVGKMIGQTQAEALAGTAVIVDHFAGPFADSLIALAQYKPGALSWLDGVEDKAPYLLLLQTSINFGKAVIGHHKSPDQRLNAAGRTLIELRSREMALRVEQQMSAFEAEEAEWVEQKDAA